MIGVRGTWQAVGRLGLLCHRAQRGLRHVRPTRRDVLDVRIYQQQRKLATTSQSIDLHSELLSDISRENAIDAWNSFATHLQLLHRDENLASIDSTTFDKLFRQVEEKADGMHECFNKLRVLVEYAAVYNLPITDSQWQTIADLFLTLWEAEEEKASFIHTDFYMTLVRVHHALDDALASRMVAALASADLVEEASKFIRACSKKISSDAWAALLEACVRSNRKAVGTYVLQKGHLEDADDLIEAFLLRTFSTQDFSRLTNALLRRQTETFPVGGLLCTTTISKLLKPIVAFVNLRSGDVRLARTLLDEIRSDDALSITPALQNLFTKAARLTASRALSQSDDSVAFVDLQSSLLFHEKCKWIKTDDGRQLTNALVLCFERFSKKIWSAAAPVNEWRVMLRTFTLTMFKHDPELTAIKGLPALLSMFISLQDYVFARQVFRIDERRNASNSRTPFVQKQDFLWMFQAALFQSDSSLQDSWQLFTHWSTTDCSKLLDHLPLSLIRKFIRSNAFSDNSRSISHLLQHLHLENNVRSRHNYVKGAQSSRLINTLVNVPREVRQQVLPTLSKVLDLLRRSDRTRVSDVLDYHVSVLWRLSQNMDTQDALDRAQCLAIFEDVRAYAKERIDGLESPNRIVAIYLTAIKVIKFEMSIGNNCTKAAQLIDEMQDFWRLDVDEIDRQSVDAVITSTRILCLTEQAEWEAAISLLNDNTAAYVRHRDDCEEAEADESLSCVPATVASRLALALGRAGEYKKARGVIADYLRSIAEEGISQDRILLESAGIALLCMQDNVQEALDRIYSLQRLGVFQQPKQVKHKTDFFSSDSPVFGPSNESLAKAFAQPILFMKEGDWKGEMRKASDKLVQATKVSRTLTDGPFFSNYRF